MGGYGGNGGWFFEFGGLNYYIYFLKGGIGLIGGDLGEFGEDGNRVNLNNLKILLGLY